MSVHLIEDIIGVGKRQPSRQTNCSFMCSRACSCFSSIAVVIMTDFIFLQISPPSDHSPVEKSFSGDFTLAVLGFYSVHLLFIYLFKF